MSFTKTVRPFGETSEPFLKGHWDGLVGDLLNALSNATVEEPMETHDVIRRLEEIADPRIVERRSQRFGIVAKNALGVDQKQLKIIAREIGPDNALAISLFETDIYEARLLCSKIFEPGDLTEVLMDYWATSFDNWEICDSFCMGFFAKSPHALKKALEWSGREEQFVKRAGFSIMAAYGFAHKEAENAVFETFLERIERESSDERHYVKKAVNWALRSIGKRNSDLHVAASRIADKLQRSPSRAAHWIGSNALRELEDPGRTMYDYPRSEYRVDSHPERSA